MAPLGLMGMLLTVGRMDRVRHLVVGSAQLLSHSFCFLPVLMFHTGQVVMSNMALSVGRGKSKEKLFGSFQNLT